MSDMLAQLYFNASDPLSELWRFSWIIPAFWTVLAYCLLVVICVLWAPSRNPTRYAFLIEAFISILVTLPIALLTDRQC